MITEKIELAGEAIYLVDRTALRSDYKKSELINYKGITYKIINIKYHKTHEGYPKKLGVGLLVRKL